MQGKGGVIMMKMTKKNIGVVATLGACIGIGNIATNVLIAKKNGYKWNKTTKQLEKDGFDFTTEDKIIKSNLVWSVVGLTVGLIAHYTIIDRR